MSAPAVKLAVSLSVAWRAQRPGHSCKTAAKGLLTRVSECAKHATWALSVTVGRCLHRRTGVPRECKCLVCWCLCTFVLEQLSVWDGKQVEEADEWSLHQTNHHHSHYSHRWQKFGREHIYLDAFSVSARSKVKSLLPHSPDGEAQIHVADEIKPEQYNQFQM